MHSNEMPQYALDGAKRRKGNIHSRDRLDPSRTALVVVDMQNVFLEEGAPVEVPVAREIVPNVNRLAEAMRRTGGTVVWVVMTHGPGDKDSWSNFYRNLAGAGRDEEIYSWLADGSHGQSLWPAMDVRDGDWTVKKNRYSAFLPESSDIAERLSAAGIDTVVITGTLTNVCCESSARDAMMRNFRVLMVSDGNAARTDEEHIATLANMLQVFGDVQSTDEVAALLDAGAASNMRAAE
jgi:ureidoacrylate peracid hydrolase